MRMIHHVVASVQADTNGSDEEWLCILYTGGQRQENEMAYDLVGPDIDQLVVANLLDRYGTPQYTIKVIRGRPNPSRFFLCEGIASLEADLKVRFPLVEDHQL